MIARDNTNPLFVCSPQPTAVTTTPPNRTPMITCRATCLTARSSRTAAATAASTCRTCTRTGAETEALPGTAMADPATAETESSETEVLAAGTTGLADTSARAALRFTPGDCSSGSGKGCRQCGNVCRKAAVPLWTMTGGFGLLV